jgi:hypothetical protein
MVVTIDYLNNSEKLILKSEIQFVFILLLSVEKSLLTSANCSIPILIVKHLTIILKIYTTESIFILNIH